LGLPAVRGGAVTIDPNAKEPKLWRAAAFAGFDGLCVREDAHHHAIDRIDQQNAIVGDGVSAVSTHETDWAG
jgi:hypothetical protein